MDEHPTLQLPPRAIPVPASISPEARAYLAKGPLGEPPKRPALDDVEGWRAQVAGADELIRGMVAPLAEIVEADTERLVIDGVPVYAMTTKQGADDRRTYLEVHGGGLVQGGGDLARLTGLMVIEQVQVPTWVVDYRMPPDHPFPAGLDDLLAVYRALLTTREPHEIVVGGGSAGGNLAAALLLRARDEGLPLPAAAVLHSPEADLTESGDSFQTLLGIDPVLVSGLYETNLLYAGGHDLAHPYLSPLFGDFGPGFPPTLITSGTRDLFLSNAVRLHRALRAADVAAELHVWEAMPHGGFLGAPESREVTREVRAFLARHWAPA